MVTKVKQDTTTSVSDMRLSRELDDISLPEHCYRKIQKPRRREYVDCPTCVPSLCNLGVAQIQTDPRDTSIVEIQVSDLRFDQSIATNRSLISFLCASIYLTREYLLLEMDFLHFLGQH